MAVSQNLKGTVWGYYTVLRDLRPEDARSTGRVWCRCACGAEKSIKAYDLLTGHTKGCRSCTSPRRLSRPPAPTRAPGAIRQAALRARRRRDATPAGGDQQSGAGGAA
jgi:hypothetical protein